MPTPTIVTTFPATVAINEFKLVYVNAPVLLDDGGARVNGASPNVFEGIEKLVITGRFGLT